MKRILFIFLCLCLSLQIWSDKKALGFADMFTAGRLSSPVISPDGQWVVFAVKTADINANTFQTNLYATDMQGRALKKLTEGKGSHFNPRFLKSGRLTFVSTRDGAPQVFSLDLKNPRDIKAVTAVSSGISNFLWSSDEKTIAFAQDIDPRATTFAEAMAMEKEASGSKVQAKLLTGLMFRVWDSWRDGKRSHVFQHRPGTSEFTDLTPGDFDTPPLDLGGNQDYLFSGDGAWFAYVKNTDPVVAISTNNDVFLRDQRNGKEKNISINNKGGDANPVFSPNNKYLAYLSMRRPGFEADKKDIILYDLKSGKLQNLTAAFPDTISDFIFGADEKTIYFIASQSIYHPIFRLRIASKKIDKIVPAVNANSLRLTPDGRTLVYMVQNVTLPQELFKFDLRRRQQIQLTRFNADLFKDVQMNRAELFHFKGAHDELIEGMLLKPPFFDAGKKYPLVFLIHGGPQGGWTDDFHYRWNHSMFASPGYVVAAINFHGSTGYGQPFTDSISGDWGGAPFIDLVKGQQYLVETFPFIDKDKIVAAGASYGGFMINWIAGHSDDFKYPFRCLVSHDGIFDSRSMYYSTEELWFEEWEHGGTPWESGLYEKWNPANHVAKFKVPILVVHGENDFRVPVTQGLMLFTALQRRGVKSKMLYFPDENHFVQKPQNARLWWRTVFDWFAENITDQ
ncbi:MAG: S9 family peptidase [Candidatus Aminicenantes bacterium]|nr:S9 family peptidase [Candidatus Aminicenantes bacterium]